MKQTPPNSVPDLQEAFNAKLPALTLLCALGYTYVPTQQCNELRGGSISKQQDSIGSQVMLTTIMREYLAKQRFRFAGKQRLLSDASINQILNDLSPAMNLGLKGANEQLYKVMSNGICVTEIIEGKKATPTIHLIDWQNPENNSFYCTDNLIVENSRGTGHETPGIVCFINGLPWVIIEVNQPGTAPTEHSSVRNGIAQHLHNQKLNEIPHLFAYSQLLLSVDGSDGLYGTCGTQEMSWAHWKEQLISEAELTQIKNTPLSAEQKNTLFAQQPAGCQQNYNALICNGEQSLTDQDRLIIGLLRKDRLQEMAKIFIMFDKDAGKVVAQYPTVFALNALRERITTFDSDDNCGTQLSRNANTDEPKVTTKSVRNSKVIGRIKKPTNNPDRVPANTTYDKARNGGVIWQTPNINQSFTMIFFTKALAWIEELTQCRIIVLTDRTELKAQLSHAFGSGNTGDNHNNNIEIATSGKRLASQIGQGDKRIIFSIINKFSSAIKYKECYNDSANILVLIDESYSNQNGNRNLLMMQTLPHAAFIAFTGTPLLRKDKVNNPFGSIIHSYTPRQAVEDKTAVPLIYEERTLPIEANSAIEKWFDRISHTITTQQNDSLKNKLADNDTAQKINARIELIAHDITDHFRAFKCIGLKGLLVCDSKAAATEYHRALNTIGIITSIIFTTTNNTGTGLNIFNQSGSADLIILSDPLHPSIKEPKNTILYLDRALSAENIIPIITQINHLHELKSFGYLIDYHGSLKEYDTDLSQYQNPTEHTQNGFDINDTRELYQRVDNEYKKLPGLHTNL